MHNEKFVLECGIFLLYSSLQLLIVSKLSEIIIIIILYKFIVSYRPLFGYIQRTCIASVVERLQLCSVCGTGSGSLGSSSQGGYIGLHVHGMSSSLSMKSTYLLQTLFLHSEESPNMLHLNKCRILIIVKRWENTQI